MHRHHEEEKMLDSDDSIFSSFKVLFANTKPPLYYVLLCLFRSSFFLSFFLLLLVGCRVGDVVVEWCCWMLFAKLFGWVTSLPISPTIEKGYGLSLVYCSTVSSFHKRYLVNWRIFSLYLMWIFLSYLVSVHIYQLNRPLLLHMEVFNKLFSCCEKKNIRTNKRNNITTKPNQTNSPIVKPRTHRSTVWEIFRSSSNPQ